MDCAISKQTVKNVIMILVTVVQLLSLLEMESAMMKQIIQSATMTEEIVVCQMWIQPTAQNVHALLVVSSPHLDFQNSMIS